MYVQKFRRTSTNFKDRKNHFYEIMIYELPEPPEKAVLLILQWESIMAFTLGNNTLENYFKEYTLSKSQSQVLKELTDFLHNSEERIFLLKGYAGTGKTFIVNGLTDFLTSQGRCFHLAAPTGKAAQVLAQKAQADAGTLHSLIYNINGMKEFKTEDLENSETYRFYANLKINDDPANTVYIVDEASMISDSDSEAEFIKFGSGKLLSDFLEYVNLDNNDHDKKIIFLGDPAQLPPVVNAGKKDFSPALSAEYLKNCIHGAPSREFLMTDIVRQKKESGILKFAMQIREGIEKSDFYKLYVAPDSLDIQITSDFDSTFKMAWNESKNSMVIARTNEKVALLNQSVRKYRFPNAPLHSSGKTVLQKGDKIIVTKTVITKNHAVYNGDFGLISAIKESVELPAPVSVKNAETGQTDTKNVTVIYRKVDLTLKDTDGKKFVIQNVYIIENLLYNNQPDLSSYEKKSQYINFKKRMIENGIKPNSEEFKRCLEIDPFFNAFCVKFGYAITCHKAQGSEWDIIIADTSVPNKNKSEYFHWLYTAVTRSQQKLYLLNFKNMDIGSTIKTPLNFGKEETAVQNELASQNTQDKNINAEETPLSKIKRFVSSALKESGIKIISQKSNNYMEEYTFQEGSSVAIFQIYYNGKFFITNITPKFCDDFSEKVLRKISRLCGYYIGNVTINKVVLAENFKKDFNNRISKIAERNGFCIMDLEEIQSALRYTFFKNDRICVLDFPFKSAQTFEAAPMVIKKLSSSDKEAQELACLIVNSLREC